MPRVRFCPTGRVGPLVVAVLLLVLTAAPAGARTTAAGDATELLTLRDDRITESSSLVVSRRHDGVLYTANDSGDSARIFAVGPDGETVGVLELDVEKPEDIEAMAPTVDADGGPGLLVGDIGDNREKRDEIAFYLLGEPADLDADAPIPVTTYRLRYEDGPRDAEGLVVDPRDGRAYVVTKGILGGSVYAAPARLDPDKVNVLTQVGGAPAIVTDAVARTDGRIIVRNYSDAVLLNSDYTVERSFALPPADQGESLALTADGTALLTGSEGDQSPVWQVPLPVEEPAVTPVPSPASSAVTSPTSAAAAAGGDGQASWVVWSLAGGGAGLVVALVITVVRARRGRS